MINSIIETMTAKISNSVCTDFKELIKEHIETCKHCKSGVDNLKNELPFFNVILGDNQNESNKNK